MNKIYGIFDGCYSDWNVLGYFTDEDLARKYCAKTNLENNTSYYSIEINNLQNDIRDLDKVQLKYYHEVVIDYYSGVNMRNEPNRYEYFDSTQYLENSVKCYFNGWVNFGITSDTSDRTKVEKIATDMFNQFLYLSADLGDEKLALEELCKISNYKLKLRY